MKIVALSKTVDAIFENYNDTNIVTLSELPSLALFKSRKTTDFDATIYNPMVCLILQGEKKVSIGGSSVTFGSGESLNIGHDLPIASLITKADWKTPYQALIITIDIEIIRSIYGQATETVFEKKDDEVLAASQTCPALVDALGRYLTLFKKPNEAEVLGPLVLKEIHYRLLMAPHGGMLRRLIRRDSHASKIGLAIEQIRKSFRPTIAVAELVQVVGMSPSSFHEHFRSITGTTPLQFQKDLRLLEARQLLSTPELPVSIAAFQVGYESSTQFSREYVRKFGVSPRNHLGKLHLSA